MEDCSKADDGNVVGGMRAENALLPLHENICFVEYGKVYKNGIHNTLKNTHESSYGFCGGICNGK